MCLIQFGRGSESLTLRIHGRTKPDAQSYWYANWLHCTVEFSAGASKGTIEWQLRNEDLSRFLHALEKANEQGGEAALDTLDDWLDVRIIRDSRGHIEARCQLEDNHNGKNTLELCLSLDQANLSALMVQLREVLERYPIIGQERHHESSS